MAYDPTDCIGTDDDLPQYHQNKGAKGMTVSSAIPYPRVHNDMESQIHRIEQEAYTSVLRAFKAQSDAITWEKESLITELRKELRVSDDEHRELLNKVNAEDIIWKIREWRQNGGNQFGMLNNAQPAQEQVFCPTVSASRKRETSQSIPSLYLGAPSPIAASVQPSSSAAKKGAVSDTKGMKFKSGQSVPVVSSSVKSVKYPLLGQSGRVQATNRSSSGALAAAKPTMAVPYDNLIGRKVMTRWPADNNFYEAVITDYNSIEGLHLLVYDINTNSETWEWVNLKEISPEDIRWEGEDPGSPHKVGQGESNHGSKKPTGRGSTTVPGADRGRGSLKNQSKKEFPSSQNGIKRKSSGDIELLHTDTLLKEVGRVFNASHPDPLEFEKAKKVLKDHEQSLVDAIARLVNASDVALKMVNYIIPIVANP